MGQGSIPHLSMKAARGGKKGICIPFIWVQKGQGPWAAMGQSPIPPLSVKAASGGKKGVCIPSIWVHGSGRHSMCEHACSDKLTSSGAGGFNSLHRSPIRVCPLQERACTFWQTGLQRRGRFSQPLPLYHSGVERAMGSHGARPIVSQFYKGRASPFKHDRAPAPYDFNGRLFRSH